MEYLSPAPHKARSAVSALADRKMLQRMQEDIMRSARVSVSVCDPDGSVFCQSVMRKGGLHHVLMESPGFVADVIHRARQERASGEQVVRIRMGPNSSATMMVVPIRLERKMVGAVVAGPVFHRKPSTSQLEALLDEVGLRRRNVSQLVPTACVASRGFSRIDESLATLAALVLFLCQERLRHDRNLTTLATLNRIGQAVNSRLSLEEVLHEVLDNAIRFHQAEEGSLMLLNDERNGLRILVARGLAEDIVENTCVPLGEGISGLVAQEGRPRLLRRGVRESSSRLEGDAEFKSAMSVPIMVRDEILGVLNVKGRVTGGDFTEEDLSILTVMASHAAGAIANARLYERVKRTASEMSALFAIGTAINSELERNQVLQRVLDYATDLLESRKGSIMLLNEENQELQIEVAYGLDDEIVSSVRLRLGEGIAGRVAQEGKPRLLRKGVAEEGSRSVRRAAEMQAALCVPLTVREKVIGVINVSDRMDGEDFTEDQLDVMMMMANQAAIAIENAKLHDELHELFVSSITALANAIDARDPYTRGHSERVAVYAVRIGERMSMQGKELDFLRYAALLHDVGKINIKDEILNKPGRLTDDEFHVMKKHPEYGAAIMMPVKAFRKIIPFMFYHHEKYCAGGGYPVGLSGDAIPLEARIISVADAYDAMTSHRPYRRALAIDQAVKELIKESGGQFDPKVVEVFLQILEEDPEFARSGIDASIRAEREGWIRTAGEGIFSPRGGAPVSPRPRIPSLG